MTSSVHKGAKEGHRGIYAMHQTGCVFIQVSSHIRFSNQVKLLI